MDALGVGIIGVDAARGWALEGHVPAVHATEGLELVAVAGRDQQKADAAAAAAGAELGYGDAADLIASPAVAVVVIAAPVPAHRDLALAAIRAGKHVVSEWPLTTSTRETAELAAAAEQAGVHTLIGLQSRSNPAVRRAAELIQRGETGRIHAVSVLSTTAGFGAVVPPEAAYLEDPATGMHLLTIQAAHTLDLAAALVGELEAVAGLGTVRFPHPAVADSDETLTRSQPDYLLVHGRYTAGAALDVRVIGGTAPDDSPFRLEIAGENGSMVLSGGAPRGFQAGLLSLSLRGEIIDTPPRVNGLSSSVVNVAEAYASLRDDLETGTRQAPGFDAAVRLSQLLDDVRTALAAPGTSPTEPWPLPL